MQGETSLAKQGLRARKWFGSAVAIVVLASGAWLQPAQAQKGGNLQPMVSLSASSGSVGVNGTVTLTATASDPNPGGAIAAVAFYKDGVMVSQKTTPPYTYNFTPSAMGTFKFTAVAVDNQFYQGLSNAVTINVTSGGPGNKPPTVTMTVTKTAFLLGQATSLTAEPVDTDGTISKVTFFAGTTQIGTVTFPPYQYTYVPTLAGTYSVTAVATDDGNATGTSSPISIVVSPNNAGKGNVVPTVSLSATATTVQVGTGVTLNAAAADSDGTIAKVEFYNGSTLLATDTSTPYSATFTPNAAGTYSMTARAYDNAGGIGYSSTVTITAQATAPANPLPRITLGLSGTLFSPSPTTTVTLTGTAAATAPATVTKVSFYQNGAKILDDLASPYTTTVTLASAGNYLFRAEVTDSLGQLVTTLNQLVVVQTAPAVASTSADVWRLLNQATFGASQAEAARVVQLGGVTQWINDQMTKPISGYPDTKYNRIQLGTTPDCTTQMPNGTNYPGDSPQAVCARDHLTLAMVQRDFFTNARYAPDQLRQRVAWALSQVTVTSANEPDLSYAHVMSRYQNIMFQEAFGNYETLLRKITYNPAMGNYLDMVNNDRPAGTRVPNENYAREIMQLFSVGLSELNVDGTPILDAQGVPVQTYGQTDIEEFARVFTGYTYSSAANPAGPATAKQGRYYGAPMVPYPTTANAGHDPNAKTLLNGTTLPAGQTGQQDIDAAVHNVFMHPNTGPFIAKHLIQHLVTGNPTTAYVGRVTAVFNNNGQGVRGDMAAVVKAVLTDTEARGPTKLATDFGQLKEPVLMVTGLLRALNAVTDGSRIEGATTNLGQRPFYSPTVFNYFMPDAKVPNTSILGPEFGIHTTVTAVGRANLVYALVYGGYNPDTTIPDSSGTKLFLAPFEAIADQPAAMVSLVNQHLAGGQFPAALEATIVTAVNAITLSATPTAAERTNRARMAVYLMASSYDYQVQR